MAPKAVMHSIFLMLTFVKLQLHPTPKLWTCTESVAKTKRYLMRNYCSTSDHPLKRDKVNVKKRRSIGNRHFTEELSNYFAGMRRVVHARHSEHS